MFDTNLCHTSLIWAIEVGALSALSHPVLSLIPIDTWTSVETFLTPDRDRREALTAVFVECCACTVLLQCY
jgi:hypothetical protein